MRVLLLLCVLPALAAAALVGGQTDITLQADDANVQFALSAINDFYGKQGDNAVRQLVKVESAKSQVVSGTLYQLVLRVYSGSEEELCEVSVWSRPWLSADQAIQITDGPACKTVVSATASKMLLLGGENVIDPNTTEVVNALNFAVDSINGMDNSMYYKKSGTIGKVTSQVVSGMSYHFYGVQLTETECIKGQDDTRPLENCMIPSGAGTQTCDFDVWYQSWMTPQYKLMNFKCQ